jgi:hypothetical protein
VVFLFDLEFGNLFVNSAVRVNMIALLVLFVAFTNAANVCAAVTEARGFGNGPMTSLCTTNGGTVVGTLPSMNSFNDVW